MSAINLVSEHACYGGVQRFYRHESREVRGPMKFAAYLPPQAHSGPVPVLYFLSGLTCTEETFCIKSHAQQTAAELGLMLISPDTSPREPRLPGDADSWDFGYSAGFYVDATQAPWSQYYRMYSYVTRELPEIVAAHLPARLSATGIFGHSMGGHGALTLALRNPSLYKSVSAFSPIAAPMQSPWGQKAFSNYLGADKQAWREYDASELVARKAYPGPILIDQGSADQFLAAELLPGKFAAAAAKSGQQLNLRMQPGYDHGYYFIQTFMADHLRHHAEQLRQT
jgi:S-formylglutathione hydrolase